MTDAGITVVDINFPQLYVDFKCDPVPCLGKVQNEVNKLVTPPSLKDLGL